MDRKWGFFSSVSWRDLSPLVTFHSITTIYSTTLPKLHRHLTRFEEEENEGKKSNTPPILSARKDRRKSHLFATNKANMSRRFKGKSDEVEEEDDYNDDDDDVEEEDEGDFVPGMDDDDDDLDDDFEEEDLDGDDDEDDPFVPCRLSIDDGKKIILDGESFHLISEESGPSTFRLSDPTLEKAIVFSGTLKDVTVKLEVKITKNDPNTTIDSLEHNLLNYQAEMQEVLETSEAADPKSSGRAKAGDDDEDDDDDDDDDTDVKGNIKSAPASSMGNGKKAAAVGDVYILEGGQVMNGSTSHKIRGVFRPILPSSKASRLFLMVSVQEATQVAAAGVAASPAKPAGSGTAASAPTSSRKRGRKKEEDDEEGDDDGVGYQEIIDLHDDAGLSTEELRRRYYGANNTGTNEPATKVSKARPTTEDSEDDDDAYGF